MGAAARRNCHTWLASQLSFLPPPKKVETLDKWFSNVCELDIMFSLETAHFIIDEMLANGCVVETNRQNALAPVQLLERAT